MNSTKEKGRNKAVCSIYFAYIGQNWQYITEEHIYHWPEHLKPAFCQGRETDEYA